MTSRSPFEVDDQFLRQVYRLTTLMAVIGTVILWAVYGLPGGLSFAIGSLFSLSAILSLELVIRRFVKPDGPTRVKRWLGFIVLGKYTIIFAGFYLLMKADWLNVYALAAGIGSSWLAGFPQATLHILYASGAWTVVRSLQMKPPPSTTVRQHPAFLTGLGGLLGLPLADRSLRILSSEIQGDAVPKRIRESK